MDNKKIFRILRIALLIIIAACLAKIGQAYVLSAKNAAQQAELKQLRKHQSTTRPQDPDMPETATFESAERFAELIAINSDLAGWLSIEGTAIDYPVMQCADDEYYLRHDFYRNESKHGCLYAKASADLDTPGANVIIYGHNMKDGSMFGELDRYKSQSFYQSHAQIIFETLKETRSYEVMAAFRRDLANDDDGFLYYQFYQADTEEEFLDFYENVKRLSIYDTNVTAQWGDTFLTLSTCDYDTENGRFVVVAKRKKPD